MRQTALTALVLTVLAGGCEGKSSVTPSAPTTSATSVAGTGGGATAASSSSSSTSTSSAGGGGAGQGGSAPATWLSTYPLDAQFPEGGIYDPTGHAFFVGSLDDGSVWRVDASTGTQQQYFAETAPGDWWTLGMAVDDVRRRLWVCAMEDLSATSADPPYDGYVWLFDLDTGQRTQVFDLSDADPEATCTDVTTTSDGTAYAVDRDFGNVYQLTAGGGVSLFAQDSELEGGFVGQNAVVVTPDENALLIAVYLTSRLVRVTLPDAVVTEVDIDGSFADLTFLSGADGMTFHENDLYVAFASELVKLSPTLADWSTATAVEVDVPNGMTDAVSTPNGLYLLNGQSIAYALDNDTDPFQLVLFTGSFP